MSSYALDKSFGQRNTMQMVTYTPLMTGITTILPSSGMIAAFFVGESI